jgi:hypothetical protein
MFIGEARRHTSQLHRSGTLTAACAKYEKSCYSYPECYVQQDALSGVGFVDQLHELVRVCFLAFDFDGRFVGLLNGFECGVCEIALQAELGDGSFAHGSSGDCEDAGHAGGK